MNTIANIQEKINLLTKKLDILDFLKTFFVIFIMVISFLFGRLSERETYLKKPQSPMNIYLPSGHLLKNNNIIPHNDVSAYVINGAQKTISVSSPTISERLTLINTNSDQTSNSALFGSKNGHTFYTLGCKSGDRIKIENRVFFENEEDAETEGYTKSKLCK